MPDQYTYSGHSQELHWSKPLTWSERFSGDLGLRVHRMSSPLVYRYLSPSGTNAVLIIQLISPSAHWLEGCYLSCDFHPLLTLHSCPQWPLARGAAQKSGILVDLSAITDTYPFPNFQPTLFPSLKLFNSHRPLSRQSSVLYREMILSSQAYITWS